MKVTIGYNPPNPYHELDHFESGDIVLSELGSVPYHVFELMQKQLIALPLGPGGCVVSSNNDILHGRTRFRALRPGERVVIEGE